MQPADLQRFIHDVADFPRPGVVFKDITPLLANAGAFSAAVKMLAAALRRHRAEQILAIESRGFLFGGALALELGLPMHLVRKPGKLPRATVGIDYELEYGRDRLETHHDVLTPGIRFAIVDDVIATGGTAAAVADLVRQQGGELVCAAFLIELGFLNGRSLLAGTPVESLIRYD